MSTPQFWAIFIHWWVCEQLLMEPQTIFSSHTNQQQNRNFSYPVKRNNQQTNHHILLASLKSQKWRLSSHGTKCHNANIPCYLFFFFDSFKYSNFILFQLKYIKTQTIQFSVKLCSVPHCKQPATSIIYCHGAGGKFLSSPVVWFLQWQASDHHLMPCLITLACRLQSGRTHRSQFCSQEQESC